MPSLQPRYSKEEFARRGDALYESEILPCLQQTPEGHFVLIDIDSGDFEVDPDEIAASDRLLARRPQAQVWLRRVGSRYAHRFGFCIGSNQ